MFRNYQASIERNRPKSLKILSGQGRSDEKFLDQSRLSKEKQHNLVAVDDRDQRCKKCQQRKTVRVRFVEKTTSLKEPLFFKVEVHPEYKTRKDIDKESEQDFKKEEARAPNQGSSI